MGKKLNETKLKSHLKLSINRLQLQKKKRSNLCDKLKRQVADQLASGNDAEAKVTVEGIIKDDAVCEAYEILELFCELLASRISVLKLSKGVPAELLEAVSTLCYAAARHQNLKELLVVRSLMADKYGKDFVKSAMSNANGAVNKNVRKKLAIVTPSPVAVQKYLSAIAAQYDVAWAPETEPDESGVFPEVDSSARVRPAATITEAAFPTTGSSSASSSAARPAPSVDAIPQPPPDFGEEEAFPEPPPNLGGGSGNNVGGNGSGGGGGGGGADLASNFPVMSVGPAKIAPSRATRPQKAAPPAGSRKVMMTDDDEDAALMARFAALNK